MALPLVFFKRLAKSAKSGNSSRFATRTASQERARRNRQISIDISVLGDKKLQKDLRKMPNAVQKKIARGALRKGARLVGNDAKATAPRDSGALAESLKIRAGKRSKVRISVQAIFGVGLSRLYSAAIELGWRGGEGIRFLRDAADRNAPQVLSLVQKEIGAGIDKAMRK